MCRKCRGWYSKTTGQWIDGDGNTSRHTVPPPGPDHPDYGAWLVRQRSRTHPSPAPVEHGTVRGIRSHKRKQEDLCSACDEYLWTDAYWRELRQQSLETVNRKLEKMTEWANVGGDVDEEERGRLKRRRDRLERQLFGEEEESARERPPAEERELLHVRIGVNDVQALRDRAEAEDVSVSELVRQAVAAFLVL